MLFFRLFKPSINLKLSAAPVRWCLLLKSGHNVNCGFIPAVCKLNMWLWSCSGWQNINILYCAAAGEFRSEWELLKLAEKST